jgi:hypothetical protein
MAPTGERAGGAGGPPGHRGHGEGARWPQGVQRDPMAAAGRHQLDPGRLLGAEPRRQAPGRRRDWQSAWAALERLADHHHRHRDDRHRPQERPGRLRVRDLGRQERESR